MPTSRANTSSKPLQKERTRSTMQVKSHSKEYSSLSLFLLTNSKTMSNRLAEPRMAVISTLSNNFYSPLPRRLFGVSRGRSVGVPNSLGRWHDKPEQVRDSSMPPTQTPRDPLRQALRQAQDAAQYKSRGGSLSNPTKMANNTLTM